MPPDEPPPPPSEEAPPSLRRRARGDDEPHKRKRDRDKREKHEHEHEHKHKRTHESSKRHKREKHGGKHGKRSKREKHERHERKRRRSGERDEELDDAPAEVATASEKLRMLERDQRLVESDPRALQPYAWRSATPAQGYGFDVRGDRDNLAFGCQFAGSVPRYRCVFGSSNAEREAPRYWKSTGEGGPAVSAAALRRRYARRRRGSAADPLGATAEFVALELPVPSAGGVGDDDDELSDCSADEGEAAGAGGKRLGGSIFERLRVLNEAVRRSPTDEAAWLQLADFSSTAVEGHGARSSGGRKAGAVAERKVSVLRRAVEANPASEGLRSALLQACDGFLPPEPLEAEWESALASFPASVALWSQRLSLLARTFGAFSISRLRAVGAKSVAALSAQAEAAVRSGAPEATRAGIERAALLLVLRVAYSERAAGFDERGVALLQALIELNCFCPPRLRAAGLAPRCAEFEPFWESEVPRVGQPGAPGWDAWRAEQTADDFEPTAFGPPPLLPEEVDAQVAAPVTLSCYS